VYQFTRHVVRHNVIGQNRFDGHDFVLSQTPAALSARAFITIAEGSPVFNCAAAIPKLLEFRHFLSF
jgi:hypothetical protein